MGPWDPPPPDEAARLFAPLRVPWWIAGGYAVEFAVGRAFRDHGDIDVLLLRRDQLAAQHLLAGWERWAADPPGTLRRWLPGEVLPPYVHDIWCRPGPDQPQAVSAKSRLARGVWQLMLDDAEGGDWLFRRDPRIRLPVERLGRVSGTAFRISAPEVQLLYKAGSPRPRGSALVVRPPQRGDVQLLHGHHRGGRPGGLGSVRVEEQLGQPFGHDLPGEAVPVLQPAAGPSSPPSARLLQ